MVNQNENENEFFLVLGPYNQNELRFGDFRRSYQNELVLVLVLVTIRNGLTNQRQAK